MNITPKTKISELLDTFPELEETLILLSPSFEKLRNPVLRRTIARVASLQQVAAVGKLPLEILINTLRRAAGQDDLKGIEDSGSPEDNLPEWFLNGQLTASLDAREMLANGEHPLAVVIKQCKDLQAGGIYELITPFTPVPLIDKVKEMGLECHIKQVSDTEIRTYFYKA